MLSVGAAGASALGAVVCLVSPLLAGAGSPCQQLSLTNFTLTCAYDPKTRTDPLSGPKPDDPSLRIMVTFMQTAWLKLGEVWFHKEGCWQTIPWGHPSHVSPGCK